MSKNRRLYLFVLCPLAFVAITISTSAPVAWADDVVGHESTLMGRVRQLTFEGRRAGEGYFSSDGAKLIFQSERDLRNPFFQMFLLDMETGDITRVSSGHGKTTCGWIHPHQPSLVLFASTHEDPQALNKQQEELDVRARGEQRRYAWDYDEYYELYRFDVKANRYTNLTNCRGYDAEASFSPDGKLIAFASNRAAFDQPMAENDQKRFDLDPSLLIDIYLMQADGSNVTKLTDTLGYDGGPFFSPDGKRICWRRFSEDGALAEIMTMNLDGMDQRQLTRLNAMSWAPFYHPSGDYLIFTTNRHGFSNFELYLVRTDGKGEPVRVTETDGFDGLPAFSPDGRQLVWTTNRTARKDSQLFIAEWNDAAARKLLGLDSVDSQLANDSAGTAMAPEEARQAAASTSADFRGADILRHVDYLCRPELEGRMTGTPGEKLATEYVAAFFEALGLEPAGDNGTWYQTFPYTSGVSLGPENRLAWDDRSYELDRDFRPLSFAKNGAVESTEVAFAGYGIRVAGGEGEEEYDSYVHLDVTDKWVVVFRFLPENISPEKRRRLTRNAHLRFKTTLAMQLGAKGLIVVSGPNSHVKQQLVPLANDGTLSGSGIPVLSVSDEVARQWFESAGHDLQALQNELDEGTVKMGFSLQGVKLAANVDVVQLEGHGRNVLGRLSASDQPTAQSIVMGAHIDHLGRGSSSSSLARDEEQGQIHYGADDNASGVAAMLEVAQYLAHRKQNSQDTPQRDVIFAAWSGEELGLLGSNYFVSNLLSANSATSVAEGSVAASTPDSLYPAVAAYLNFDMVGRLDKNLVVQGVGSSSVWPSILEQRNVPIGLAIVLQNESILPTDSTSFFNRGVPAIAAFTGSHEEYHTPRDTPDRLNYEGAARVARLFGSIARGLVNDDAIPDYVPQSTPTADRPRGGLRAYLGTIPDYASDVTGVKISGASAEGPAALAGLKGGDVIVELAGMKVENIYDYTFALEALKIGKTVTIVVQRDGQRIEMAITPGSRE